MTAVAMAMVAGLAQAEDMSHVVVAPGPVTADVLVRPEAVLPGVSILTDLAYAELPGFRPLVLDLYRPQHATAPLPLAVYLHGGGWTTGQKRITSHYADFPGVLADLARRGFAVASVDYRLSGEARYPAAVQDVKAALRFLRREAPVLGLDATRVALWGGSAGAHLAMLAALSCGDPKLGPQVPGLDGPDDCVQGVVGWYGPYDLPVLLAATASSAPADPAAARELAGGLAFLDCTDQGCPEGRLTEASPITRIGAGPGQVSGADLPAVLLLHGSADTLVPMAQSDALAAALRAAGGPVETAVLAGVGHGWAGATQPETEAASRRALVLTFDWLERLFPAR